MLNLPKLPNLDQLRDPAARLATLSLTVPEFVFSHKRPDFSTAENLTRTLDELKDTQPTENDLSYARNMFCVHGTNLESLTAILKSRTILPYAELIKGKNRLDFRLKSATDCLDISLRLDRSCFLSLGRTNPASDYDVLLCFPNKVAQSPDALIATKEIVHHGATVSRESAAFKALATGQTSIKPFELTSNNDRAVKSFFASLINGTDYITQVLPRMLAQPAFSPTHKYFSIMNYPGVEPRMLIYEDDLEMNSWEGPQVMLPSVNLDQHSPSYLVLRNEKQVVSALHRARVPNSKIFCISESQKEYRDYIKKSGYPVDQRTHLLHSVNIALWDLIHLAAHNDHNENFVTNMVGFKQRAKS